LALPVGAIEVNVEEDFSLFGHVTAKAAAPLAATHRQGLAPLHSSQQGHWYLDHNW